MKQRWAALLLAACAMGTIVYVCGVQPGRRADVLFAVQDVRTGKWGYVNQYGVVRIPAQYEQAGAFTKQGLAVVSMPGEWGERLIDMGGNDVLGRAYSGGIRVDTQNGWVIASQRVYHPDADDADETGFDDFFDDFFAVFDCDGTTLVPYQQGEYRGFNGQTALIERPDGIYTYTLRTAMVEPLPGAQGVRQVGYLDGEVFPFTRAPFRQGQAGFSYFAWEGKWGLMNLHGEIVVEETYDRIAGCYQGRAFGYKQDGEGGVESIDILTTQGKRMAAPEGILAGGSTPETHRYMDGLCIVWIQKGKSAVMDMQGQWILGPCEMDWVYRDGVLSGLGDEMGVDAGERCAFYDTRGRQILQTQDLCLPCRDGYVMFRRDGRYGMMTIGGAVTGYVPQGYRWDEDEWRLRYDG